MRRPFALAAMPMLALLAACTDPQTQAPTRANFTAAVDDYLARRGHLCLAKYDWPVVVTSPDSLDAAQMPVLESLGLVKARAVGASARAYDRTPAGDRYWVQAPVVVATATRRVTRPADFCVARLALDRVLGWETPLAMDGRTVSSVLFTYRIDPAPWTHTPDARRAFPVVSRAIANAGSLQLRLGVHLTDRGWVADELSS